jgi:hypothetical protein
MATNVRALTITGAVVAAVIYVICATFVALAPELATRIGSDVTHINMAGVGRSVTWGGALIGIVFTTVFGRPRLRRVGLALQPLGAVGDAQPISCLRQLRARVVGKGFHRERPFRPALPVQPRCANKVDGEQD